LARTALTQKLRQVHAAHREAAATGMPVDEVFERQAQWRISRSAFVAGAAGAAASLLASCTPKPVQTIVKSAGRTRVLIVGGGLAGMTCAYRLWNAGVPATICDANSALGGRTWTLRKFFADGQLIEHGGEFVSSEHTATRKLAAELGLHLEDLRAAQPHGTEEIYYVRGHKYMFSQLLHDYAAVYPALDAAAKAAPYPTLYNHHTQAGLQLDRMSSRQWIEKHVPGGRASDLGWLLDVDVTTENGGDADVQSALELVYMLGYMPAKTGHDQFYLVGTDERYHVIGGNDQMVARMSRRVPGASVRPSTALLALGRRSDGSYVATFSSHLQTFEMAADHVVLAIPFSTLRRVDLSRAGFAPLKHTAIDELGMGTNSKLHLQFGDRLWYRERYNGYTYSDTGFQQTWEASRAQPGRAGILTNYTGGSVGASYHAPSFGPADPNIAKRFLAQLEPIYAGATKGWNGKAFLDYWTADPWHRGSYSYLKVGQYTRFSGMEAQRQGNVHFCGEHTSINFGGFMNGAVETGEAAAREVLADLHVRPARAAR